MMLCSCVLGVSDSNSVMSVFYFVVIMMLVSSSCGDVLCDLLCYSLCLVRLSMSVIEMSELVNVDVLMSYYVLFVIIVMSVKLVVLLDMFSMYGFVSGLCSSICNNVLVSVSSVLYVKFVSVCGRCSVWMILVNRVLLLCGMSDVSVCYGDIGMLLIDSDVMNSNVIMVVSVV